MLLSRNRSRKTFFSNGGETLRGIAGQLSPGSLLVGDRQEGAHRGELLRLHRRARHQGFPVWGPHLPHQVSPGQGVGQALLRFCPLHPQVSSHIIIIVCCLSSLCVRVLGRVNDTNDVPQTVPIPPNIDTVNALFGTSLDTEEDMVAWLDQRRPRSDKPPANGEEMSISRVRYIFFNMLSIVDCNHGLFRLGRICTRRSSSTTPRSSGTNGQGHLPNKTEPLHALFLNSFLQNKTRNLV